MDLVPVEHVERIRLRGRGLHAAPRGPVPARLDEAGRPRAARRRRDAAPHGARRHGGGGRPGRPPAAQEDGAGVVRRRRAPAGAIRRPRGPTSTRTARAARRAPLRRAQGPRAAGYKPKRTKTGWATGQEVLEELAEVEICQRRSSSTARCSKLVSTYVLPLPRRGPRDRRIHTSFNQTVAATGPALVERSEPPEHPDPHRGGKRDPPRVPRRPPATGAPLGRLLARSSCASSPTSRKTRGSIDAFREGRDIHRETAARVFDVARGRRRGQRGAARRSSTSGSSTAWGRSASRRRPSSPSTRRRRSSSATSRAFPKVRGYLDSRSRGPASDGYVVDDPRPPPPDPRHPLTDDNMPRARPSASP